jgi:ABC-type transporter Mla MlaB component
MGEAAVKMLELETETLVAISGPMTIDCVGELKSDLLEAFGAGKKVQLSLAGVTRVDFTGLQLLCSYQRASIDRDLDLSIDGDEEGDVLPALSQLVGMLCQSECTRELCGICVGKRVH